MCLACDVFYPFILTHMSISFVIQPDGCQYAFVSEIIPPSIWEMVIFLEEFQEISIDSVLKFLKDFLGQKSFIYAYNLVLCMNFLTMH